MRCASRFSFSLGDKKRGHSVKAISLWEPWATLVAIGQKQFETRSWSTEYRGPLLICAAKRWRLEQNRVCNNLISLITVRGAPWPELDRYCNFWKRSFPLGHAVAVVNLANCIKTEECGVRAGSDEYLVGDYSPGRFAWQFTDLIRFRVPMPVRGAQGLFSEPDELVHDWSAKYGERTCRICGCSPTFACKGGCAWEPGQKSVCTVCARSDGWRSRPADRFVVPS